MKKNVMMRVASLLMVCVLATTCGISGTFAKYVTADNAQDTARVAEWGVEVSVVGQAFATTYDAEPTVDDVYGVEILKSVVSSNTDNLVAPGTTGTFTGIAVSGSPEVAIEIATVATMTLTGWEIDADNDALTPDRFYCPIVINVNGANISGMDYTAAADFINAVEGAIETANGNYQANTDLASLGDLNGSITWTWAFENGSGAAYAQSNEWDTMLGNLATAPVITLEVSVTVAQIN